jgi:lipopolysaccharide biosynthesis glycosyltransferase
MYTSRPNLMNIYNFAAFYIPLIPRYKYIEKLIYLDTDVVVLGDIRSIDNRCCDNKPAAAVEDCSQRLSIDLILNIQFLKEY